MHAVAVISMHVRPHQGDPWNELADVVCGSVSLRGIGFTNAMVPPALTCLIVESSRKLQWLPFEAMSEDRRAHSTRRRWAVQYGSDMAARHICSRRY